MFQAFYVPQSTLLMRFIRWRIDSLIDPADAFHTLADRLFRVAGCRSRYAWIIVVAVIVGAGILPVKGDIVAGSHVSLGSGSIFGYDYQLTISQNLSGSDVTALFIDHGGTSITLSGFLADESADLYFAELNDVFSTPTIISGGFTPFDDFGSPVFIGYQDFFLGINTGLGFDGSEANRDVYGWVQLRNTESGLEYVGSAMAYNESGIIIGTINAVPEPQSVLLLSAGLLALANKRSIRRWWIPWYPRL